MGKLDENAQRYRFIRSGGDDHDHRNLQVSRTGKGRHEIMELVNTGDGVPEAIGVAGFVKCIVCDAVVEDSLICSDCKAAVRWMRSANYGDILRGLVELLIERPYILEVFKRMSDEVISEYFLGKIQQHRD